MTLNPGANCASAEGQLERRRELAIVRGTHQSHERQVGAAQGSRDVERRAGPDRVGVLAAHTIALISRPALGSSLT